MSSFVLPSSVALRATRGARKSTSAASQPLCHECAHVRRVYVDPLHVDIPINRAALTDPDGELRVSLYDPSIVHHVDADSNEVDRAPHHFEVWTCGLFQHVVSSANAELSKRHDDNANPVIEDARAENGQCGPEAAGFQQYEQPTI